MGQRLIVLAVTSTGTVHTAFLMSVVKLVDRAARHPKLKPLEVISVEDAYVGEARDVAAREFLRRTGAQWLIFADADVVFTPDDVLQLLEHADPKRAPIVAALALGTFRGSRGPDPRPTAWYDDLMTQHVSVHDVRAASVAVTGFELIVIHRSVVEAIAGGPYRAVFEVGWDNGMVGEDVLFCRRARELGFPIYVARDVRVGHRKIVELRA